MPQINNLERNMEDKIPKEINFLGEGWVNLIPRVCNQNEESITFAKTGLISLSTLFVQNNNIKDFNYVKVKFKKEEDFLYICFEFIKDKEENILKLTKSKTNNRVTFSGSSIISQTRLNHILMRLIPIKQDNYFIIKIKLVEELKQWN